MRRATSLYLDLLRGGAAVGVFLGHVGLVWFAGRHDALPGLGHALVMVFFVLSGYVIAHATLDRPVGVGRFAAARLSRLYSVVAPAVVLTVVLLLVGRAWAPAFYVPFSRGHDVVRALSSLGFAQELWWFSATPPSNEPLWSLGYEAWYYVIFGCWMLGGSRRARLGLTVAAAAVAGPKILLLFPAWLLGVGVWYARRASPLPRPVLQAGFAASAAVFVALTWVGWSFPGDGVARAPWFYSGQALSDWVLGIAVATNIYCFDHAWGDRSTPAAVGRPIRALARVSFSLYAYHFALLVFVAAVLPFRRDSLAALAGMLALVVGAVLLLHQVTEAQRPRLRRWLERRLGVVGPGMAPPPFAVREVAASDP